MNKKKRSQAVIEKVQSNYKEITFLQYEKENLNTTDLQQYDLLIFTNFYDHNFLIDLSQSISNKPTGLIYCGVLGFYPIFNTRTLHFYDS